MVGVTGKHGVVGVVVPFPRYVRIATDIDIKHAVCPPEAVATVANKTDEFGKETDNDAVRLLKCFHLFQSFKPR